MILLPSEQKRGIEKAIKTFNEKGELAIYEPCNCGAHIRHNNGGNYHQEIFLRRDEGQIFIKISTTSELEAPAEWEPYEDWEKVIQDNSNWLGTFLLER